MHNVQHLIRHQMWKRTFVIAIQETKPPPRFPKRHPKACPDAILMQPFKDPDILPYYIAIQSCNVMYTSYYVYNVIS